jgi:iron complex transport system substrate-binding protein
MFPQRIVSFLPSATEMIFGLGAGDRLVGVTHECDYPAEARAKPVVVRAALPLETMSSSEIDRAVSRQLASASSLYTVDEQLLRELAPDLIVTQELCQVCAPSGNEITQALQQLRNPPRVLTLTPHSLEDVLGNLREVGSAIGCLQMAETLIDQARERLTATRGQTADLEHPRVFCMEWTDPVYCSGHWVPEMTEIAGGVDRIGRRGSDSTRIPWHDVVAETPEVVVIMPCGFSLGQSIEKARELLDRNGWNELPAVRNGRVFAVDANSYFARPGPRLVDGVELLAHLFHPQQFIWRGGSGAFQPLP